MGRLNEEQAWHWLQSLTGRDAAAGADMRAVMATPESGGAFPGSSLEPAAEHLLELYLPLCKGVSERFVVAHLGQSLDGRIAAANGASRWVTGPEDVAHNHRMRALFDAVVVGAGTIESDDPQLTVRAVPGRNPVRVVLDPRRRLADHFRVFSDGAAPTLLLYGQETDHQAGGVPHGRAEAIGVAGENGRLSPRALLDCLARRGLKRVFVEGGGITVSHFLAAGCLDRLQIAIAPLIIGSGRPSITLPEISGLSAGLRPPTRCLALGRDILVECCFDG
jgi:riboflavin-specific deaminase-like protein